ncbi:MAG TPA: hypothetical protein VFU97_24285 [Xanthobacteraceae bacterium]|nr:hypothetical protein [Xanthobacteraceae bacterium]
MEEQARFVVALVKAVATDPSNDTMILGAIHTLATSHPAFLPVALSHILASVREHARNQVKGAAIAAGIAATAEPVK